MSRDGLPRAYLRIDPNVDQVYPELRNTFVGLLCSAHRQPQRGRYRDRALLEALHSKVFVRRCYARGDLVDLSDGHVYVDGWDQWQEGDVTVAERMRRVRARKRSERNGAVTEPSPERVGVTTDAVAKGSTSTSNGDSVGDSPPNPPQGGGRNKKRERERVEREAELERQRQKRADRITSEMHARRLETWRHTGKWEAEWGPEPAVERHSMTVDR